MAVSPCVADVGMDGAEATRDDDLIASSSIANVERPKDLLKRGIAKEASPEFI